MENNNGWSFGDLDLSGADVDSGEARLKVGRYVCEITEAELKPVSSDPKAKRLAVKFKDTSGHGTISESINIHLPKSPAATQIGMKQLRTLLTHGGHPTPEKPGDIKTMVGLKVGVLISKSSYEDQKTGEQRVGSQVDSWHPYFTPEGAMNLGPTPQMPAPVAANTTGPATVGASDFDDIPF